MDEQLVEAVALRLLASKIARKASGYAHLRAGFAAPFPADYEDARAIIPLIQQAERAVAEADLTHAYLSGHAKGVVETEAQIVAWLRSEAAMNHFRAETCAEDMVVEFDLYRQALTEAADAIERGEHKQESQP